MTNQEWIELFFSESFEKQINDLILEDWDYEVPRDSIINYVHNILSIPYSAFLYYISIHPSRKEITTHDVPELPLIDDYTHKLINYIKSENDRGVKPEEVGFVLNNTYSKSFHGNKKYGQRCLRTSSSIGLVYEYYGQWYLNCLTYAFGRLTQTQIEDLMARMCLRSPLFSSVISKWWVNGRLSLIDALSSFSSDFVNRRLHSILIILDLCRKSAKRDNIEFGIIEEEKERFNLYAIRQMWSYLRVAFPMCRNKRRIVDDYVFGTRSYLFSAEIFNELVISCAGAAIATDLDELETTRGETEEEAMISLASSSKGKYLVEGGDGRSFFAHYSNPVLSLHTHIGEDYSYKKERPELTELRLRVLHREYTLANQASVLSRINNTSNEVSSTDSLYDSSNIHIEARKILRNITTLDLYESGVINPRTFNFLRLNRINNMEQLCASKPDKLSGLNISIYPILMSLYKKASNPDVKREDFLGTSQLRKRNIRKYQNNSTGSRISDSIKTDKDYELKNSSSNINRAEKEYSRKKELLKYVEFRPTPVLPPDRTSSKETKTEVNTPKQIRAPKTVSSTRSSEKRNQRVENAKEANNDVSSKIEHSSDDNSWVSSISINDLVERGLIDEVTRHFMTNNELLTLEILRKRFSKDDSWKQMKDLNDHIIRVILSLFNRLANPELKIEEFLVRNKLSESIQQKLIEKYCTGRFITVDWLIECNLFAPETIWFLNKNGFDCLYSFLKALNVTNTAKKYPDYTQYIRDDLEPFFRHAIKKKWIVDHRNKS